VIETWCVARGAWRALQLIGESLHSFAQYSFFMECRSSDRRMSIADHLFANADLKIGVPNHLPHHASRTTRHGQE